VFSIPTLKVRFSIWLLKSSSSLLASFEGQMNFSRSLPKGFSADFTGSELGLKFNHQAGDRLFNSKKNFYGKIGHIKRRFYYVRIHQGSVFAAKSGSGRACKTFTGPCARATFLYPCGKFRTHAPLPGFH